MRLAHLCRLLRPLCVIKLHGGWSEQYWRGSIRWWGFAWTKVESSIWLSRANITCFHHIHTKLLRIAAAFYFQRLDLVSLIYFSLFVSILIHFISSSSFFLFGAMNILLLRIFDYYCMPFLFITEPWPNYSIFNTCLLSYNIIHWLMPISTAARL